MAAWSSFDFVTGFSPQALKGECNRSPDAALKSRSSTGVANRFVDMRHFGVIIAQWPTFDVQLSRPSPLHVKYRYGNFYNCPVRRKGISVTGR